MFRKFSLILFAFLLLFTLSACHSDPDPWQPLPSTAATVSPTEAPFVTAAPSLPTEEELAEDEIQQLDPAPTPGGEAEPGLNG